MGHLSLHSIAGVHQNLQSLMEVLLILVCKDFYLKVLKLPELTK